MLIKSAEPRRCNLDKVKQDLEKYDFKTPFDRYYQAVKNGKFVLKVTYVF